MLFIFTDILTFFLIAFYPKNELAVVIPPDIYAAHIRSAYPPSASHEPQPLEDHLMRVALLARSFAQKAGIPLAGYLVGLTHDLGKYSALFQRYIRSAAGCIKPEHPEYVDPLKNKGLIDHSTAGGQHLWRAFAANSKLIPMNQMLAMCVFSHHSGLQDCVSPEGDDIFTRRINKPDKATRLAECLERCNASIQKEIQRHIQPEVMKEIHAAIKRLHKRIEEKLDKESDHNDILDNQNSRDFQQGLLCRFLLSCLLDADRIDSAEFDDPVWKKQRARMPRRPWDRLVRQLEAYVVTLTPRHEIDGLRQAVSRQCARRAQDNTGLFTLTVPTGGGKTLASLRFALRHAEKHALDRVIYIIPYTSIIDQNAGVARRIFEKDEENGSIVLEHHSNIMPPEDDAEAEGSAKHWDKLAENWEAPLVFTTMAQFLESLFGSGARHTRRMHNLARSVLVFDEIQALPVRCLHMFCNAINFLVHSCGSTAVLCTATQPGLDQLPRPHLGSLPLSPEREIMEDVPGLFAGLRRTVFFDHCEHAMSADEVADLALAELHLAGSCLVICNVKALAEKIYVRVADQTEADTCYLSTNLCPAHRMEQLTDMRAKLHKRGPLLCISTQLVECGVDISFGSVIRYAAGLDSILQAAGRSNRHGGSVPGRVHVVKAQDNEEHLDKLPDIRDGRAIFLDAIRVGLANRLADLDNDFTHPDIIATYFEHYFYRRSPVMAYAVGHDTLLNMLGSNSKAAQGGGYAFQQSFASAAALFRPIDSHTRGVIVPYKDGKTIIADLCSASLLHRKKDLLRKAQRYSVNVFSNTMNALKMQNALYSIQDSGIFALDERFYHSKTGLATEPRAGMSNLLL